MIIEKFFLSLAHNYVGHHGAPAGATPVVEADTLECVAGRGVRGDRFFDYRPDYAGQITFFSAEVFAELCAAVGAGGCSPGAVRRNVIVHGADLNGLIGREFELQSVWFRGAEECRPCYWMNEAVGPGAEAWLKGRGGLRARILTDGILHGNGGAR